MNPIVVKNLLTKIESSFETISYNPPAFTKSHAQGFAAANCINECHTDALDMPPFCYIVMTGWKPIGGIQPAKNLDYNTFAFHYINNDIDIYLNSRGALMN